MRLKKRLRPFVDSLPIPSVLKPVSKNRKSTNYVVRMREFFQKLHRDLPPTRLWGYEGKYPGPTIETKKNELVRVLWLNQLPSRHLLPVDKTVHGANNTKGTGEIGKGLFNRILKQQLKVDKEYFNSKK